jgi:voltage-gated potassium channel
LVYFSKIFMKLIRMNNRIVVTTAAVFLVISSLVSYTLEPDTFGNVFNSFWWVMTTVTTVGYGDYYPHTIAGKCFGIVLYIFGISLISIIISKVADSIFSYNRKKEEGKLRHNGEGHFVVINWSKHAELAIQEIMNSDPYVHIVLIEQLDKTPLSHDRVHYVKGNPVHQATLEQANLSKAKAVFIFADEITAQQNVIRDTSFIDGKTLLIATSIERYYEHAYTIVEIKERENMHNFVHVKVDEFILGSETISQMAVRSAFNPGASKIMSQLLSRQHGEDLFEISKRPHWQTYRDAFEELLRDGATLISEGEHMNINRRLDEPIRDDARLFVICDKEIFESLFAKVHK